MTRPSFPRNSVMCLILALALAACGRAEVARGINDPYEAHNRGVHALNRDIDRALLRPAANGYGTILPVRVQNGIGNFASNLGLPSSIVNDVLQANAGDAIHNVLRLMVNSTLGLAGILDPATEMGLERRTSDFGETLHVWGAAEGHYVELPLLGPSTKRDTIGSFVDLFTNPISYILPSPERYAGTFAGAASTLGDRYRFGDTIDSILYDSADSYAQARLLYLESRRFQLGGGELDSGNDIDPYGIDPYAE